MRKLLVSTLLVLFAVTVFALESDPSETVGFIKYPCVTTGGTDLNLVGYTMDAGYAMASDLGNAIGTCDAVSYWDAAGQGWITASNAGFMWLGDFALVASQAYMCNVTANVDVYIAGGMLASPTFSLVTTGGTDLNMITLPLDKAALNMASLVGNDIGVCDAISYWDATGQGWITASNAGFMWLGDFATAIGDPMLANVTANTTWPTAKAFKNVTHSQRVK